MRIVGLVDFSGSVSRANATVSAAGRISSSQKVAAEAREAEAPISTSRASAGRAAPIDQDRVAEIRRALEENRYPLVGTEIADAIIAAGLYGKIAR